MRINTFTFNIAGPIWFVFWLLILVGVLPLTLTSVMWLLLGTQFKLPISWTR